MSTHVLHTTQQPKHPHLQHQRDSGTQHHCHLAFFPHLWQLGHDEVQRNSCFPTSCTETKTGIFQLD